MRWGGGKNKQHKTQSKNIKFPTVPRSVEGPVEGPSCRGFYIGSSSVDAYLEREGKAEWGPYWSHHRRVIE